MDSLFNFIETPRKKMKLEEKYLVLTTYYQLILNVNTLKVITENSEKPIDLCLSSVPRGKNWTEI